MGILNVTPDSFSDGGKFYTVQTAVDQALRLEDQGADILDIGGESTRPYSQSVESQDELQRVAPVLEKLQGRLSIPVSIDTTKACVAMASVDLGAEIINDVSGLSADAEMIEVACRTQAGICAMHMQGNPHNMQDNPLYEDVVAEIISYLSHCNHWLIKQGVAPERICLDPGIGFGKTHEHNWTLVRNIHRLHSLGRPLLVGHSRKGFIAKVLGSKDTDRMFGTIGVSLALASKGVQVLRVHDVAANKQSLELFAESYSV